MNRIKKYEKNKTKRIEDLIYSHIKNHYKTKEKIVIVCVGSDRCTGDCLAPLIGTKLKKRRWINNSISVYGTLKQPVHAKNLDEVFKEIDEKNSLVIAIDAALGASDCVGDIIVETGSLFPGIGVGKTLTPRGDINIKGIVEESKGVLNPHIICNIRLFFISQMAKTIELALNNALKRIILERNLRDGPKDETVH